MSEPMLPGGPVPGDPAPGAPGGPLTAHDAGSVTAAAPTATVEPIAPPDRIATAPVEPTPGPGSAGPGHRLARLAAYVAAAVIGAGLLFAGLAVTGGIAALAPSPSPSPSPSPEYMQGSALGDPSAPVTVEVWADYQCPYCGLQARGIEPSIERTLVETGLVRLVFRDFAFLGQESKDAAVAARCAARQDAFWYFHDLMFASQSGENQGAFARERLVALAQFAGLDQPSFTACLDDPAVLKAVTDETAAGKQLGVGSTPTIHVVGPGGSQLLTGLKPLSAIVEAVERLSKPASSGSLAPSGSPAASPAGSGSGPSPSPGASTRPSPSPSG